MIRTFHKDLLAHRVASQRLDLSLELLGRHIGGKKREGETPVVWLKYPDL